MPFWVHKKGESPESGEPYEERHQAVEGLRKRKTFTITFMPTYDEILRWRRRESDRFANGTYVPVPWKDVDRYRQDCYDDYGIFTLHYAHLSLEAPGMVLYTPNHEYALKDRKLSVRPGRYLQQFYAEGDPRIVSRWKPMFTPKHIEVYAGRCNAEHYSLNIATSAEEIADVYRGGPTSCMGGTEEKAALFKHLPQHPTAVYGDSDFALAYVGPKDKATARCLVRPAKKTYGRLYGHSSLLKTLLERNGWKAVNWDDGDFAHNGRVRAIQYDGTFLMPYVDGITTCSLEGDYFVLDGEGEYDCQLTNGLVESREQNSCQNCGEDCGDETYCSSCDYESFYCVGCDETRFGDYTSTERGSVCHSCRDDYEKDCESCRESFLAFDFTRDEERRRCVSAKEDLCRNCQDKSHCEDHDVWYIHECDDCAVEAGEAEEAAAPV